jgi:rod shape-determining protein MreC
MVRRNRTVQFLLFAVASLGVLALHEAGTLTPAESLAAGPLTAVQSWLQARTQSVADLFETARDLQSLRDRVEELERENAALQIENVQLYEDLADFQAVSQLLDFTRANAQLDTVAAQVIGRDSSNFLRSIIIDKGAADGLAPGMAVITERGLVGRVSAVSPSSAKVMLLTDPSSAVNARLQTSRADGTVEGQLTPSLRMRFIPQEETVKQGEVVLTSGLGRNFPGGIVIGQVINVERRDVDLFQTAELHPTVDFNRLEIVLVVTSFRPTSMEEFGGAQP